MIQADPRWVRVALAAAVIVTRSAIAAAEPARRVEVGGFLGVDYFGDDIELGNSWAPEQVPGTSLLLGGRSGLTILPDLMKASSLDPQLGVEGELKLALASTGSASERGRSSYFTPVLGWRVHAIMRLRRERLSPHLVAGVGGESVITGSPFMEDDTDVAFYWGPGLSWRLSPRLDARADLRHALAAGRVGGVESMFELHVGVVTGWELAAGGGAAARRDRDGDRVADGRDECPDQRETGNGFRDDDGCPDVADRDGDRILDPDDKCVDEPETRNDIDDGDGCPELDEDGDGLVGGRDACPRDAEDYDKFEDQDGCPDRDNDKDQKPDVSDVCPDQGETFNGFDDDDGCPDELPKAIRQYTGAIEGIRFEYNRARILPASKAALNKAAAVLREFASIRIRIEGHTDSRGVRAKNLALSHKRAETVKWYLVDRGIAADRIETLGRGSDAPRVSNTTAQGRALNRRVEFHVVFEDPTQTPAAPAAAPSPAPPPTR